MNILIEQFLDGIFSLHTRRFGTVAEIMVQKIYQLKNSKTLKYDKSLNDKRIEIKFSRALRENEAKINNKNIIEQCLKANYEHRIFKLIDTEKEKFDCNIQQIKKNEFDILYYGIFYQDFIEIFKITSKEIIELNNYSDKQHRGNIGEGQFHLNNSNIDFHRKNYLIKTLTYEELYNLFLME